MSTRRSHQLGPSLFGSPTPERSSLRLYHASDVINSKQMNRRADRANVISKLPLAIMYLRKTFHLFFWLFNNVHARFSFKRQQQHSYNLDMLCYVMLCWTILTCAQKLTCSQLSLPHGNQTKKNNEETKNIKRRCSEETVQS